MLFRSGTEAQVQENYRNLSYNNYEPQSSIVDSFTDLKGFENIISFLEIANYDNSVIVDDSGNPLYIEMGYSLVYYERVYMWDHSTITETQYVLFDRNDTCVFNKSVDTSYICD